MDTVVPRTILLVEDEAIIAMDVQRMLRKHGFAVLTASSGEKAVETVEVTPGIDLILMDINLGRGIDGTEAARRILATHDIPLIFHSSHTEPEVVEKTEGITSYGYIVKNSGETVLLASIRMAFRLWESEGKFRTAFEHAGVGIVLNSTDGQVLRLNEAFASMLGYTPQELSSLDLSTMAYPDDRETSLEQARILLCGEADGCDFTKRYIHRDGHMVWTHVSSVLFRNPAGVPLYFISHVQNITELKQTTTALAESKERLASILKAIPTGIGVIQGVDRILMDVNEKVCTMTGYSREELIGNSVMIFYPTRQEYEYVGSEKYRQIAEHGTGAVETRWKRKDGSILDVYLASAPIYPSDLSRGVTFSALDIGSLRKNPV